MTCPLWILTHPDLTDCDIRVLLMLDQIGWREVEPGQPGGVVHANNHEIGRRIGKSASTVSASIRRMESIRSPIIERQMSSSTSRSGLVLLYDRFGDAAMNHTAASTLTDTQDVTEPAEIPPGSDTTGTRLLLTPANIHQAPSKSLSPQPGEISHSLPIKREEEQEHQEWGELPEISPGSDTVNPTASPAATLPSGPRTLPELISWLPGYTKGDNARIEQFAYMLPLWHQRFRDRFPQFTEGTFCDWATDALIESAQAKDPVKYAGRILKNWGNEGGRPGIEIALPTPIQAEPVPPQAFPAAVPTSYANGYHPKPSKADRNAQAAADRDAVFDSLFAPKEASNGPR